MTGKDIAVLGVYPHRSSCEHAFSAFKTDGFQDADISVFFQKNPQTDGQGVSRATIGGVLGSLARTSTAPGLEQFFIAGPAARTLAEIADGGTLEGLAWALSALGVPQDEAKKYEARVENGEILMLAHCMTSYSVKRARRLFVSTGAEDIYSMGEFSSDNERSSSRDNDRSGDHR